MVLFNKKNGLLLLLLVFLCGCSNDTAISENENSDSGVMSIIENAEIGAYKKIVSYLKNIELGRVEEIAVNLAEDEEVYLYVGRSTCLNCREFVIENKEYLLDIKNLYYVDTENMNKDEKKMLSDMGIEEVPAIASVSNSNELKIISLDIFLGGLNNE